MILFLRKIRWFLRNFKEITPYTRLANIPQNSKIAFIHNTNSHGNEINYFSDGMLIWNNCDCLEEEIFKNAYTKSLEVNDWRGIDGKGMDMRWRYYLICFFADQAKKLQGDYVECGVYKGGYSKAIIEYTDFNSLNKTFYLLDTFEGLAAELASEEEKKNNLLEKYSHYENTYEFVKKTFQKDHVQIIKGKIPDTLSVCDTTQIAFLSIDMNMVFPEIEALHYFWDKLISGAIIVLDDYGFFAHIEQKKAFDKFAMEKSINILSLPTGQAIIFKP
jgi:hypothetical protein